jgi:hypothetical protein
MSHKFVHGSPQGNGLDASENDTESVSAQTEILAADKRKKTKITKRVLHHGNPIEVAYVDGLLQPVDSNDPLTTLLAYEKYRIEIMTRSHCLPIALQVMREKERQVWEMLLAKEDDIPAKLGVSRQRVETLRDKGLERAAVFFDLHRKKGLPPLEVGISDVRSGIRVSKLIRTVL